MDSIIKRIEVDVYTPTFYEVIKAQQGDSKTRFVEFVLYNQGDPYTVPVGVIGEIYIAGIQNIPNDLIEAAKIDGASKSQILRKVTIPLVMPSVTICLFLTISNAFKLFDQNLALTDGAPSGATSMLALDIYKTFYSRNGWEGVGQAKAVIFFIIVAILMIIQLNITRKKEVES